MTQKRKHELERSIRRYFKDFEVQLCSFTHAVSLLQKITQLLLSRANYLNIIYFITLEELCFMIRIIFEYSEYYFRKLTEM